MRMSISLNVPPELHLLAVSVTLLKSLRRAERCVLFIPKSIHEVLTTDSYGTLLYDTLSEEFANLEEKLSVRVHPKDYFLIESE